MTQLVLIRHAEQTSWLSDAGQPIPVAENRLTERGLEQARRLADRLAHSIEIDALYASPLRRALQTAEAIRGATALPLHVNENLAEIKFNNTLSLTAKENEEVWLRVRTEIYSPVLPGAETFADFHTRAVKTIEAIAQAHPDQSVAIVTHGGVIEQSLFHFLGIPIERNLKSFILIDHTAIYEWRTFEYKQFTGWQLLKANDTHHLDGLL